MSKEHLKRFRAKVDNWGFRGQHWMAGQIVEVTPDEAEVIPHHFEELGKADDGSADAKLQEKLQEQEQIDNLKDKKAKESYDRVEPRLPGGAATPIAKSGEDLMKDMKERKAEEKANEKRRAKADRAEANATANAEDDKHAAHHKK